MEIFHIHDTVITKEQFSEMSASILWMAMTEDCHEHHHHHHNDEGTPARESNFFPQTSNPFRFYLFLFKDLTSFKIKIITLKTQIEFNHMKSFRIDFFE